MKSKELVMKTRRIVLLAVLAAGAAAFFPGAAST